MSTLFSDYTWYELIGPVWIIILGIIGYIYIAKLSQGRHFDIANSQTIYFFTAILLLYLVKGSPFSNLAGDYLFSAHVLQLSVMFFIVAPFLILSLPAGFMREQLWKHKLKTAFTFLNKPWITGILFSICISFYFLPPIFNTLKQNSLYMFLAQSVLMFLALLMWWEIVAPLSEEKKLTHLSRIAYIFMLAMLLMPIGFFLLLVQDAVYPAYEAAAGKIFSPLSAVYDQQLGGGILKAVQLGSYMFALFYILRRWGKEEEEREGEIDDENIRVARGVVIYLDERRKK